MMIEEFRLDDVLWTPRSVVSVAAAYVAMIFLVRTNQRRELRMLITLHNLMLMVASLVMTLGVGRAVLDASASHSLFEVFCDEKRVFSHNGPISFWLFMFFISKGTSVLLSSL